MVVENPNFAKVKGSQKNKYGQNFKTVAITVFKYGAKTIGENGSLISKVDQGKGVERKA